MESQVESPQESQPDLNSYLKENTGLTLEEVKVLREKYDSLRVVEEDDWLKTFIDAYKGERNPQRVLELMTTDFEKMSPEEIVKYDLRRQHPEISDKYLDRMVKSELEKYGIKEYYDDEDDEGFAKEVLNIKTKEIRERLQQEREKFLQARPNAAAEAQLEEFAKFIDTHPATKELAQQRVMFDDFKFAVNPDALKAAAVDANQFFQMFNKEGNIDLDKFYKVAAFAQNPEAFLKAQNAHVIAKAKIEWLKELKNPSSDPPQKAPTGQVTVRLVR